MSENVVTGKCVECGFVGILMSKEHCPPCYIDYCSAFYKIHLRAMQQDAERRSKYSMKPLLNIDHILEKPI